MSKGWRTMILISTGIIIAAIIYNSINNYNVKVVTQEIEIEDLPYEFQGFTILQFTDLHGKSFGENQERLISVINGLEFDIIGITGDMQNRQDNDYEPFIKLIEGIDDKENIFYTPGNHGPMVYKHEVDFNSFTNNNIYEESELNIHNNEDNKQDYENEIVEKELTDVGLEMKELGVKFLDEVYSIKRGNERLWISELIYEDEFKKLSKNEYNEEDIKLAFTHYPMSKAVYEGDTGKKLGKYDLITAGHYHGGQWRLPFVGGLFIPDLNESGIFPAQDRVSGLTEWGGFKQYVSTGVGAGGPLEILRFRFFNKPEINLIKLIRK